MIEDKETPTMTLVERIAKVCVDLPCEKARIDFGGKPMTDREEANARRE